MPDFAKLAAAATIARGLAMDAVHTSSSGHLGLPLGATELGAVLYGDLLRHDPPTRTGSTATGLSSPPATAACSCTRGFTSVGTRCRSTK